MLNYLVNIHVGYVDKHEVVKIKVLKVNDMFHAKCVALKKVEKLLKGYKSLSVAHQDLTLL